MDERRAARHVRIHEQLRDLIEGKSPDLTAAMATIRAVLHAKMPHHFWTGSCLIVRDTHAFPGHVACDVRSKTEIVVPVLKDGEIVAVFDVDSDEVDRFREADVEPLAKILSLLDPYL